ncbi:GroES-like protein [Amniculicola lignicola CBS 123094]|uniref:GroES-like protein n=1 Tax=Amniculicola lignicola CBS 123094 TaxID=1392246 RepID=A0A6A5VZ14_9PLEO|nr:GroES-like protein [Amniculicola lignicola CBS 123094]
MAATSIDIPTLRKAIVQDEHGKGMVSDIPIPELPHGMVLVQTKAVAINPVDYKMGAAFPAQGTVVGSDFAGTIVAIADGTETDLSLGDLVCGVSNGSNPAAPSNGGFATYLRTYPSLLIRMDPTADDLAIEQVTGLGLALSTCTLAFWDADALDLPGTPDEPFKTKIPILVYGGSTATGTIAIQLLKLSGFEPIATCSPRNFDLVRGCGASAVFDYVDPDTPAAIKQHTGGRLKYVLDCISDAHSVDVCFAAIARTGGRYASLELVPDDLLARRRAVKPSFVMAYEISGEGTPFPGGYGKPPAPRKKELCGRFFLVYTRLLSQGKLRMYRKKRLRDGFEGILEGLAALQDGSMMVSKMVVFLS